MEIKTLRYFLAVAREENMTRAAENLHVTQPTLSKQLKSLEDELGQKLFLDSGTLTPVLKKLEEKGYVTRSRCPEDERSLLVDLTDEGLALREKALSVPNEMMKYLCLTRDESMALYQLLYKLLNSAPETE